MTEADRAVRDIERWVHRNFMAAPDELVAADCNAVRSLRMMAWTKSNETLLQAANQYVAAFHTKLAAWRATISAS